MHARDSLLKLFDLWEQKGLKFSNFSFSHIAEVESEILRFHELGFFEEIFFMERINSFRYKYEGSMLYPVYVIIVAVPQPIIEVSFTWQGAVYPVRIPPTYDFTVNSVLGEELKSAFNSLGYHTDNLFLPLKILAVKSGLAEYGRNNLCYIKGWGSFFRLMAFVTDYPELEDNWREPCIMERCKNCRSCIVSCPTNAISDDRFMINAQQCLTFYNERNNPFPVHIPLQSHNCLIGCMICQLACPENKINTGWIEKPVQFTEAETAMILYRTSVTKLPEQTIKKLEKLCLLDEYPILARNLSVLINPA